MNDQGRVLKVMEDAEKNGCWVILRGLAKEALQQNPNDFIAACYLQAAVCEIAAEDHPHNREVQAVVDANRRVRRLADEQEL